MAEIDADERGDGGLTGLRHSQSGLKLSRRPPGPRIFATVTAVIATRSDVRWASSLSRAPSLIMRSMSSSRLVSSAPRHERAGRFAAKKRAPKERVVSDIECDPDHMPRFGAAILLAHITILAKNRKEFS